MMYNYRKIFIIVLLSLPFAVASAASGRKLVKDANKLYQYNDSAKVAEALEKYLQARESRKERFEIPFNIGKTYSKLGHETEAQTWLEEAARSTDKKVKADANYQLGNNQFRKKKWDEAIRYYTDALRSNPSDSAARKNLELALWQKRVQPPDSSKNDQNEDDKKQEQKQDSTQQQQQQPQRDKMLEQAREREAETQRKLMQRRNQGEPGEPPSGKDW